MLRTLDDADRLRAELVPDRRIIVIGAGFIGAEVAALWGLPDVGHSVILERPELVIPRVVDFLTDPA